MALAVSTPASSLWHSSSSYNGGKPRHFVLSNSAVSVPKSSIFQHVKGIPQLGFGPFPWWSGLKQLGPSISQYSVKMGKNRKTKGKGVYASLFGVGAPEVLVIGVVALLVFGPKGLAEVARNLGKTLRAFQPTIRELQEVSREFKSSLEREIGLDEVDRPVPRYTPRPTSEDNIPQELKTNVEPTESPGNNESPSDSGAYTADEYLKVTETQLQGTLAQLQKDQQHNKDKLENQSETQTSPLDTTEEASSVMPPSKNPESSALQDDASKPRTGT